MGKRRAISLQISLLDYHEARENRRSLWTSPDCCWGSQWHARKNPSVETKCGCTRVRIRNSVLQATRSYNTKHGRWKATSNVLAHFSLLAVALSYGVAGWHVGPHPMVAGYDAQLFTNRTSCQVGVGCLVFVHPEHTTSITTGERRMLVDHQGRSRPTGGGKCQWQGFVDRGENIHVASERELTRGCFRKVSPIILCLSYR